MPKTATAKRALRESARKRARNIVRKKELRTVVKAFQGAVTEKKKEEAREALRGVFRKLDKFAKIGFLKKNKANRIKSRFSKKLAKLS